MQYHRELIASVALLRDKVSRAAGYPVDWHSFWRMPIYPTWKRNYSDDEIIAIRTIWRALDSETGN
jgi:hypothetical protein